jgi:hypothetical protein
VVLLSPWRDVVVSELPDLQLGCASVLAVSASTLFACHNSSAVKNPILDGFELGG